MKKIYSSIIFYINAPMTLIGKTWVIHKVRTQIADRFVSGVIYTFKLCSLTFVLSSFKAKNKFGHESCLPSKSKTTSGEFVSLITAKLCSAHSTFLTLLAAPESDQ